MIWALTLLACVKPAPPTMLPDNTLTYQSEDGWTAEIRHYPGEGEPVLLVHGMGANHYNWDYREEVSLAHYLNERGWDVWIPELRADPGSTPPNRRALRSVNFDQHAIYDLPAAVDAVLSATDRSELYWVGHSMGGMLLYTALASYPDKVAAGVAISSPSRLEATSDDHKFARGMGWAMNGRGRIPQRAALRLSRPLGKANPVIGQLANPKNLEWDVAFGLAKHAIIDLPKPVARQAIQWLRDREVTTLDGEPWIRPTDTPLLVMGGTLDRVVSEPDVAHTCTVFPRCEYIQLSKEQGFTADYGHIDTVLGKNAREEIYPLVADFLADQLAHGLADSLSDRRD